jgi:hypothetical protein
LHRPRPAAAGPAETGANTAARSQTSLTTSENTGFTAIISTGIPLRCAK